MVSDHVPYVLLLFVQTNYQPTTQVKPHATPRTHRRSISIDRPLTYVQISNSRLMSNLNTNDNQMCTVTIYPLTYSRECLPCVVFFLLFRVLV